MAKAKSTFAVIRGGRNSGPPATQTEAAETRLAVALAVVESEEIQ